MIRWLKRLFTPRMDNLPMAIPSTEWCMAELAKHRGERWT